MNKVKLGDVFSFPETVNEYATRVVAGLVITLSAIILTTQNIWLLGFLAYGFWARVLTGPTLSPMGLLATKGIIPALGNLRKTTIGAPKRFAQGIGVIFSSSALWTALSGFWLLTVWLLSILTLFATLEAVIGFCAGCWVFKYLIRWHIIPENICIQCQNLELSLSEENTVHL